MILRMFANHTRYFAGKQHASQSMHYYASFPNIVNIDIEHQRQNWRTLIILIVTFT